MDNAEGIRDLECCRRVLSAGIWLIENGWGKMQILPYVYATGHWRCEFHPAGSRGDVVFRYSIADQFGFLSSHGAGETEEEISDAELARRIRAMTPAKLRKSLEGPAAPEMLAWLGELRRQLTLGNIPIAFDAFEDWSDWDYQWALARLTGTSDEKRMPPMPGFSL